MTIPTKTALGQEELKSRAHRLSQRHRTILLLVDGRRPLSEVLSLAQQAGAATSHFEDLVCLGLVDVPAEPEPVAPEPPSVEELQAQVTEVRLEMPAPSVDAPTAPEPDGSETPDAHVIEDTSPAAAVGPARVSEVAATVASAAPAAPREVPVLGEGASVDPLQQVRDLLIDTLRLDAPLFSARMFVRVRNARTTAELIDLVWEIQDHLARARRAHRRLVSLQRARDLLGLGNTLVAEDSTRPPLDDNEWLTTR